MSMRRVKDGLTKAQRYNRNMENIFAYAEKVNKNRMNWLRQQGVSEDEIQNAKANTGLGKDGLYNLVIKVARENGDRRLNSDILREIDDLEAIRNVKDGCNRKVKDGRVDFSKRLSEDEYNSLVGMDIEEARKNLGNWWILENQSVNGASNDFYTFERAGFGRLTLYVDNTTNKTKNIVKRVDARVIPVSDSRKVKDGYSNNPNYFGDWYGEGQIDFDAIINPEDDGDLYMVKIWGGSGYVLDVYLVKAYDVYQAIDIVFDWSYENEGANNIIFDYEYLSKLCHEDYEDEYWYGKGNGKPSDTMTYEEFEDEWLEYYIQSDNDLYARGENFFVDVVPQDVIEENRVKDSYDDVEQDIANNKGISTLSMMDRFVEQFSFLDDNYDGLIDFTTDEVEGKDVKEKAKNVLKEFETCLNYAVKGIKPKCNVKVNYKSNDFDTIFFDMVITCGDKTRKESGNISVGAYPDEWCFDVAEDINDMIEEQ